MPPNFFIVGAPKAGSTSLYHYLDQHPQIYMCPVKEPCHFAPEVRPENLSPEYRRGAMFDSDEIKAYLRGPKLERRFGGYFPEWADYLSLFEHATKEIAIGEASVCYLWSPSAARNIAARLPNAKIVAVLRHPVERAWSQYLHGVANGHVTKPFRQHIDACLQSPRETFSPAYPFLEVGLYAGQIRTYLELFPRENVRVYFYQDGLATIVADLFRFLGVGPEFKVNLSRTYLDSSAAQRPTAVYRALRRVRLWESLRKITPPSIRPVVRKLAFRKRTITTMAEEDRKFLCAYYREDVTDLSTLVNRDLSSWLA